MLNSACEGKFYVFHGVDIIWTILCLSSGLRGTPSGKEASLRNRASFEIRFRRRDDLWPTV